MFVVLIPLINVMKRILNIKSLVLLVSVAAIVVSCGQSEQKSGIKLENLDTSVRPADDFYQFACGGWMKNNPLPDDYSCYGSTEMISQNNTNQINVLLKEIADKPQEQGSVAYKIAILYNQMIDSVTLNKEGIKPLEPELKRIRAINDKTEFLSTMFKLYQTTDAYFSYGIDIDPQDSRNYIVFVAQGGLSLGEREYYIDTDENTLNIMSAFRDHVTKMFEYVGYDAETAKNKMNDVIRIETRMAKVSKARTELRNTEANYNRIQYSTLCENYKNIDFDKMCDVAGYTNLDYLCLCQPEYTEELNKMVVEESLEAQKSYLEWVYINAAAYYLSDDICNEHFNFYGKVMSGRVQDYPRWYRAADLCSESMPEAVGQLYVEKYFPSTHKERMTKMVKNLQNALRKRIMEQEWMSDSTKNAAIDKLNSYYVKIGYPDQWRDYSHVDVSPDKSLWENIMAINANEMEYETKKHYNQPVDRNEWGMSPQTVNAYYNPATNEICFPAGILQYPFFDMEADDAFNYGAIGVVIGHEMTHGFDDEGRKFDKNGNLSDWWAKGDAEKFVEHVTPLVNFFNNIEVLDGLKANGELTLGENLADHGGLQVAYQAFLDATKEKPLAVKDGFTPQQRFFIAYATVWACNIRDEEIRSLTKSDPHSLERWRVNGTLPHINAWYEAFDVKEGDKLFVPAAERVDIW